MSLTEKLEKKESMEPSNPPQENLQADMMKELQTNLADNQRLMDILKGYVSTQIDRDTDIKMATQKTLSNIKGTSESVLQEMNSTLKKQETLLSAHKEMMQKTMENGKTEMSENNSRTLKRLQVIESSLDGEMSKIRDHMKTEIGKMSEKAENSLKEVETKTSGMIWNARKNILLNDWMDVAKYGLGTAVFVVPIYLGVKYLFSVLGLPMP